MIDQAQGKGLAKYFTAADACGDLVDLLGGPLKLASNDRRLVLEEEGWILGVH